MVPAEGKGMAFKVRHGLFIGKGHGLLVQAGGPCKLSNLPQLSCHSLSGFPP